MADKCSEHQRPATLDDLDALNESLVHITVVRVESERGKHSVVGVLEDQRIPFDVEREDAKHCVLRGEGMERKADHDRNVIHHRNLYAPRVSIGNELF